MERQDLVDFEWPGPCDSHFFMCHEEVIDRHAVVIIIIISSSSSNNNSSCPDFAAVMAQPDGLYTNKNTRGAVTAPNDAWSAWKTRKPFFAADETEN